MLENQPESPINAALRSFEAAEANFEKLERLLNAMRPLTPDGIQFGSDPNYDDLCRTYADVLNALPKIDGWKPQSHPIDLNELAQCRLDAHEIGEVDAIVSVEERVTEPARELATYRHQLNKKRRQLVRQALSDTIEKIDVLLRNLKQAHPDCSDRDETIEDVSWDVLKKHVQEIETLLGNSFVRPKRWTHLNRHLSFGQVGDLVDILSFDWPPIKTELNKGLYDQNEPIPVEVEDLGILAAAHPTGTVTTQLKWKTLSAEDFERLIFSLISGAAGYENPEWLMRTNAPDRGRDLSVARVVSDALGGVIRSRVIIQCRHWLDRSVSGTDIAKLKEQMAHWEPPACRCFNYCDNRTFFKRRCLSH